MSRLCPLLSQGFANSAISVFLTACVCGDASRIHLWGEAAQWQKGLFVCLFVFLKSSFASDGGIVSVVRVCSDHVGQNPTKLYCVLDLWLGMCVFEAVCFWWLCIKKKTNVTTLSRLMCVCVCYSAVCVCVLSCVMCVCVISYLCPLAGCGVMCVCYGVWCVCVCVCVPWQDVV